MLVIVTGMLGLMIGFAFWWTYFDFAGGRRPRTDRGRVGNWMFGHLPATMSIAATGAAMVSLVEHAADDRAPAATAWLLALLLVAILSLVWFFAIGLWVKSGDPDATVPATD